MRRGSDAAVLHALLFLPSTSPQHPQNNHVGPSQVRRPEAIDRKLPGDSAYSRALYVAIAHPQEKEADHSQTWTMSARLVNNAQIYVRIN